MVQSTSTDMHLLLDSGHAYFAGADPVEFANQYAALLGNCSANWLLEGKGNGPDGNVEELRQQVSLPPPQ